MNTLKFLALLGICSITFALFSSCNSDYTPKRRGYYRIDFPQHQYQTFNEPGYPYTFEYPPYANVLRDTSFFETRPENPWWINIDFPRFNARIYISYKDIGPQTNQGSISPNPKESNTFDK